MSRSLILPRLVAACAGLILGSCLLAVLAGCVPISGPIAAGTIHGNRRVRVAVPDCWVPPAARASNYGGGSCAYAATETALRQQGLESVADYLRSHYSGEAFLESVEAALRACDVPYVSTSRSELAVLRLAHRNRVPAMLFYYRNHAVTFVRFDQRGGKRYVVLVDNNTPHRENWEPMGEFMLRWAAYGRGYGYAGGVALVVLSPGEPPMPPCRR